MPTGTSASTIVHLLSPDVVKLMQVRGILSTSYIWNIVDVFKTLHKLYQTTHDSLLCPNLLKTMIIPYKKFGSKCHNRKAHPGTTYAVQPHHVQT